MAKKSKTLTQEQKDQFVINRDEMKLAFEKMRKSCTRPIYPDRGLPYV